MSDPNGQPWLELCTPWATADDMRPGDDDCAACTIVTADTPDDETIEAAILEASEYLHAASRFMFGGQCEAVARPCPGEEWWWSGIFAWAPIPWFFPAGVFPPWWGGGCWCGGGGGCCGPPAVALGHMPIVSVEQVKIDGEILDSDEYRISYGGNLLSRVDPDDPTAEREWPRYQRLDLPDTEEGTWSVAYTYGAEVPALGRRAAMDLACELLKQTCGAACSEQVVNVVRTTRGGVTKELQNPTGDILAQMPASVKMFLAAYNPGGYRTGPRIRRPRPGMFVTSGLGPQDQIGRWGWDSGCIGC